MTPKKLSKAILILLLILPLHSAFSERYYVSPLGTGTGSSWADPLGDVQTAINTANSGDEIWVKTGTYKPHASDRTISFTLKAGVKLYGGFQGTEANLEDRLIHDADGNGEKEDWEFQYPTILSGEIQDDADETNNSQHVVTIPATADASTLIDGFTIQDGYTDVVTSVDGWPVVAGAGVVAFQGKVKRCSILNNKAVSDGGDTSIGGGVVAVGTTILSSKIKDCHAVNLSNTQGNALGGGAYIDQNSILKSCYVVSCSSISANSGTKEAKGGGIYIDSSISMNNKVANCKAEDASRSNGGGIYSNVGIIINTVVYNCSASFRGGGMYIGGESYVTNSVVARCKVTETSLSSGGGVYSLAKPIFYNTILWKNQSAGISAQISLATDGKANNCAKEGSALPGNDNLTLSSDNTGTGSEIYPMFNAPTSFTGTAGGDATKEAELLSANWNLQESSPLIEKGTNDGFNEALLSKDLNGNGNNFETAQNFTDLLGENRLFNNNVDIGAYENIFIDLELPTASDLLYGNTLADVVLTGGSAKDNRDGSTIDGSFAFYKPSFKPEYTGEPQKFRIAFTATDNVKYPVHYDSLWVNVTAKLLTLSGLSADDKIYDGNTDVSFSGTAVLTGVESGDDVTLTTTAVTAAFSNKNAGVDKPVVFSGYTLSGADKANYFLILEGTTATIIPKAISMLAMDANDKVYDGTTLATYSNTPELTPDIVAGDDLSVDVSTAVASFDTKHVGIDKTVSFTSFALAGVDKDNYKLSQPLSSVATITKLPVSVTGIVADDKTYDGNTNAVISGTAIASGLVSTDDVSLDVSSAEAHFDTKDVGNAKTVTFSSYAISGTDDFNYEFTQPAALTANITAKELTIKDISISSKTYDGTTVASIVGIPVLEGVVTGEDVSLNTASVSASFSDANAGADKNVAISGYSLAGTAIGNYNLKAPTLTGNINKVIIDITADDVSKIFGESDPVLTYVINSGSLVGSDSFSGELAREVGEDVGNYNIAQGSLDISSNYNIVFAENTFTINQAANTISFTLESPVEYSEGKQITLSATATSGETVMFKSSDSSIASVSGNTLTIHKDGYGTISITATEETDGNYVVATPVELSLFIQPKVNALRKGSNMLLVDNSDELFTTYQWYKSGSAISAATKQYYYNNTGISGEFYCEVTTAKGDKFTSNVINTSTTQSMSIYPSPAKVGVHFNVKLNGFEESKLQDVVVDVYSLTGELVKQINNPSSTNAVSVDKPGVYMIKANGDNRLTQKVIVK